MPSNVTNNDGYCEQYRSYNSISTCFFTKIAQIIVFGYVCLGDKKYKEKKDC